MHIWFGWVPCTCTDAYAWCGWSVGAYTLCIQMALADWFSGSLPRSGMLEMFMIDAYVVANVAFFEPWFCNYTQKSMRMPYPGD